MNDRSWLHRSQNNQPNGWSTYCRTDNTLHEDEVSYRKQTIDPLKGKPETGIDAADIYPKLTIRFPYAAPFECCLSGSRPPP